MQFKKKLLLGVVLSAVAATSAIADGQITIIQTGDFHGHLTPRPNLRSDSDGLMVGGLARIKTKIQEIQAGKGGAGNTLVMHTGDTIQGSGEALYTKGQALVDVVDMLGIDAYAPGNWDFVYGPERFKELFATSLNPNLPSLPEQAQGKRVPPPLGTRWGGLVSNLYLTSTVNSAPKNPTAIGTAQDANVSATEYNDYATWYMENGQRVLPPYRITTVNGVKIGIVGCTTSRGPQVVGSWVTTGLAFTDCSREVPKFAAEVRSQGAELVVLLSEIEIGRNIQILKNNITTAAQHVDVILNSDMHEETLAPIEVIDGAGGTTWILEAGQDGTLVNEITLSVQAGQVTGMNHLAHRINENIVEDVAVASKVAQVRAPFNEGFDATIPCDANSPYWNTFTETTCLTGSLSDVVGTTDVALHRSNYSHENMAAVVEGSSHDFIADSIRWWAKSDLATVRGFRYGTHVKSGPITRNDLHHLVPIGPRIAKVSRITANMLRNQIDNSSLAVFSADPNSPVIPLPKYNNTYGNPFHANWNVSPGIGLPKNGLAGTPQGWGGGWLFGYSAEGFHVDFAPYYVTSAQTPKTGNVPDSTTTAAPSGIYTAQNIQAAIPPNDTSRARSLTLKLTCASLPPAEVLSTGCNVNDSVTRYTTVLTEQTTGVYKANWKATFTAKTGYILNPDGWNYLAGTPNNPNQTGQVNQHFKGPTLTMAGFWYAKSPNTVNNCNNCYPSGYGNNLDARLPDNTLDTTKIANSAYVLPVNATVDGSGNVVPALDSNGNPIYVRDANNNVIFDTDYNGTRKPRVTGSPIDLTTIIEKYLAYLGNHIEANELPLNRIGLVNNDGTGPISLPDFTGTFGFPLMQPLCGTIGKTAATTLNCP